MIMCGVIDQLKVLASASNSDRSVCRCGVCVYVYPYYSRYARVCMCVFV